MAGPLAGARGWRRPAIHFVLIGTLLFGIDRAFGTDRDLETFPALGSLTGDALDEELLYREAWRRGYHEGDAIVERRLVRNLAFASRGEPADAADRVRDARALGMDRSDVVVRRRLVQRIVLETFERARAQEPTEEELLAALGQDVDRFSTPRAVALTHVFSSGDRHGERIDEHAREQLARLRASGQDAAIAPLGDPFLHGQRLPLHTRAELRTKFGADFARDVVAQEPGEWHGPIASTYGLHLVRVDARRERELPPLANVRDQARESVFEARGRRALDALLVELRARAANPGAAG